MRNRMIKRKAYAFPVILKTLVPHLGHTPLMAFILFFMVTSLGSLIWTDILHFMHLPSGIRVTSNVFVASNFLNIKAKAAYLLYKGFLENGAIIAKNNLFNIAKYL